MFIPLLSFFCFPPHISFCLLYIYIQNLSRAVLETFVRMYEGGLIYRAKRLVNWCCALNSAISDEEVFIVYLSSLLTFPSLPLSLLAYLFSTNDIFLQVDELDLKEVRKLRVPGHGDNTYRFGAMWEFAYIVQRTGKLSSFTSFFYLLSSYLFITINILSFVGEELVVATTRPETMLADAAVAVHPNDPRYIVSHCYHLSLPSLSSLYPTSTLLSSNLRSINILFSICTASEWCIHSMARPYLF